ncbi:MAG: FHA domain-containing protein [Planctomycetota bacterium]|nr:FHA domain-containing protein [Planctomycetota bacterium]
MLASPANQLSACERSRSRANLLTLEVSDSLYGSVLLSPGKWTVGSAATNQIVINNVSVAAHQCLIVVTETCALITDWSGTALKNESPLENAALADGDIVQIGNITLSFRLAQSNELISQLPYVAQPCVATGGEQRDAFDGTDECAGEFLDQDSLMDGSLTDGLFSDDEIMRASSENSVVDVKDRLPVTGDAPDRLDELIARIETSLNLDEKATSSARTEDVDVASAIHSEACPTEELQVSQLRAESLEVRAAQIDEELRQLDELRIATRHERMQLIREREQLSQNRNRNRVSEKNPRYDQNIVAVDRGFDDECDFSFDGGSDLSNAGITFSSGVEVLASGVDDGLSQSTRPVLENECSSTCADDLVLTGETEQVEVQKDFTATAEREKLRHYIEEFDAVEDRESEQADDCDEEEAVTVGAASLAACPDSCCAA